MRLTSLLTGLCAIAVATACSPGPDPVARVDAALASGDLERAETYLKDVPASSTASLRDRIDAVRDRREETRGRVAAIREAAVTTSRAVTQRKLQELRAAERDPVVRAEIDRELSGLAELYLGLKKSRPKAEPSEPQPEPEPESEAESVVAVADQRPTLREEPTWDPYERAAPEPIDGGYAEADEPAGEPVVEPGTAEVDGDVWVRVEALDPGAEPEPTSVRAWVNRARQRLRDGDLAGAHDAYLEAAANSTYSVERDEYTGLARDVGDRVLLREELVAAFASGRGDFSALGVEAVRAEHVVVRGEELGWSEVPSKVLVGLAEDAQLSLRAELGLIQERLLRDEVNASWKVLAQLESDGRLASHEVAGIVGRYRGEFPPKGGYTFFQGDWIAREELASIERTARLKEMTEEFAGAKGKRRDELYDAFFEEGAKVELIEALGARWRRSIAELARDRTMKKLAKLAEARTELDEARAAALELIFDEEEYFYPYRPPECPPERAKLYPAVQRRVDVLVQAVRDVWAEQNEVELAKRFRGHLAELSWNRERQTELRVVFERGEDLPEWIDGLDPDLDRIALRDFAWNEEERDELARSRKVLAYTEALWNGGDVPENGAPADSAERRQVEITNEYRLMFGRRALAWNPLIQAAAEDHSIYMSDTGDFGHFEPDPERKTPGDRMRRRGYVWGASENCHMGGGDPMGAHVGWLHSSGHHRNILMEGHREMASGLSGPYWTQNFGAGRDFEAEL